MGDMTAWVGVAVSALSLLVAAVALLKSDRAQRDANAAQRRIVEIEEQRERDRQTESIQARLRAEIREVGHNSWRLYLTNYGAGEAQNVRVEMDDKLLAEHPAALESMPEFLGAESEISCLLRLCSDCSPPFRIKITWDDASGNDRTYSSTLTW